MSEQITEVINWWEVTRILSLSGVVGGLAFHLVKHEGKLVLPRMAEAPRNAFELGVGADILVGIAAANAIHIGVSGIASYAVADTKFYTTFIALGVLAGFGGATLLKALSEKLRETVSKGDFSELVAQVQAEAKRRVLLEATRIEGVIEDSLLYRREPKPSDGELLENKSAEIRAKPASQQSAVEMLVLAFTASEDEKWEDVISLVEAALKKTPPTDWLWAAYNLLGLAYHYSDAVHEDWFARSKQSYGKALEAIGGVSQSPQTSRHQEAVTKTNLAFACLDNGNLEESLSLTGNVLELTSELNGVVPLIVNVARVAKAAALARLGKYSEACYALDSIPDSKPVSYLFKDGSVSKETMEAFRKATDLVPIKFKNLID